jgi:hypothetical protein
MEPLNSNAGSRVRMLLSKTEILREKRQKVGWTFHRRENIRADRYNYCQIANILDQHFFFILYA